MIHPQCDTDTPHPAAGRGQHWQCDGCRSTAATVCGSWGPCAPQEAGGTSGTPRGMCLAWERLLCSPGRLWSNQDLVVRGDHSHSCVRRRMQ